MSITSNDKAFRSVRVVRTTAETEFELIATPRRAPMPSLPIPNRLLSHFVDHLCKASGINVELTRTEWPGSWSFDHVLCEDLGQLFGRAVRDVHDQLAAERGVVGRASTSCCMDDAQCQVTLTFEGRARASWAIPDGADIDGFVDSWYDDEGSMAGWSSGTNLRQFVDGFTYGANATVAVDARETGNLHHLYETVYRALGDAIAASLGLTPNCPGDMSGLARQIDYTVTRG